MGISLAYVVKGEVRVGVVHAPFQGETFVAVRGGGAALNGRPLEARATVQLADALISTGFPHDHADMKNILARLGCVIQACRDLRRLASPAIDICWIAAGRLDAAYETLRPWDVAAARLVAREMGVQRDHYSPARAALPPELRGDDVVFARAGLIEQLLAVLRLKA